MVESTPQWRVHGLNASDAGQRSSSRSQLGAAKRVHSAAADAAHRRAEGTLELVTPALSQQHANLALQSVVQRHEAKVSGLLRAQHKLQTENARLLQDDAEYRQRRPAFAKMEVELARQDALLLALSLEIGEAKARTHLLKVLESGPKLARRQKTREELRWQLADEKKKLRSVEEDLQKAKSHRTQLAAREVVTRQDLMSATTDRVTAARARVVELEQDNLTLQVENASLERLLQHGLAVIESLEPRPQPAHALDFGGESRFQLQALDTELFDLHEEHTQLEEAIIGADDRVKEAQGTYEEVRSRLATLRNKQTEVVQDDAVVFQAQVMAERRRLAAKSEEVQTSLTKLKEARANKGEASRGGKLRLMRMQRDFAARGEAAERLADDTLKEHKEQVAAAAAAELQEAHRMLSDAQLKTKFAEEELSACESAMPQASTEAREAKDRLQELHAKERAQASAHERKRAEFQERTALRTRLQRELQEAKWQEEFTREDWSKKVVKLEIREKEVQEEVEKLRKHLQLAPNPSKDREEIKRLQAHSAHAHQQVKEVQEAHAQERSRILEAMEKEREAADSARQKHRMAVTQDESALPQQPLPQQLDLQHEQVQQLRLDQHAEISASLPKAPRPPVAVVLQDPVAQAPGSRNLDNLVPASALPAPVGVATLAAVQEVVPSSAAQWQHLGNDLNSGHGGVVAQPQPPLPRLDAMSMESAQIAPTDMETSTQHSVDIESAGDSVLLEHVGVHLGVEHHHTHRVALHSPSRGSASYAEDSEVSAISFEACLQDLLLSCIDDDETLAELAREVEEAEATLAQLRHQRGDSTDLQSLQARCMGLEAEREQLRDQVAAVQLHVRKAMATPAGQGIGCPRCGHAVPSKGT